MFKFKIIKPFVEEMLILFFVVVGVTVGLLSGKFIEITIKPHLLSITASVIVIGLFLFLFSRVINLGVKAIIDYIFQRTKTGSYVLIKELPYRASVFSEKFTADADRSYGMYYLLQMKKDDKVLCFISSSYLDLKTGKEYIIKSAASSCIVLDWSDREATDGLETTE